MKILVLGGDGYLGWPTALHLSERGHDVAVADNFARRQYDYELGAESLVPIEPLQTRIAAWREVSGKRIGLYIGDLCDAEFTLPDDRRVPARRHRPLRRAAGRAVLDDRPEARRLHPDQQRRRQPQRAVRDRGHEPGHPPGQARHDGRVRHAQHRHRGRLARGRAQGPQGPGPVPEAAGLLLPPVQGARQPQHRVRLPDLGAARHRPQPGRGVRPADPGDRQGRAAGDPVRLRRRVRHRAEQVRHPGRARTAADRVRQGRPDPRHARHQGHRPLHRAGLREPGRARRVPGVQPDHRVDVGRRDRPDRRQVQSGRGHDRAPREPAGRARGALLQGHPHRAARARAGAAPAVRHAHRVAVRDHQAVRAPGAAGGHAADGQLAEARRATPPTSKNVLVRRGPATGPRRTRV